MSSFGKYFAGIFVMIFLIVGTFIFSLRSCLSKYDVRQAIPPVLYFGKGETAILFSLVKYSQTISYSNENGITTKSYNTSYSIQCNMAINGEKISNKKIHGNSRIKHFPETVLGADYNNHAWIFLDELMAFDAFTLQKIADEKIIEEKNPILIDKLPNESQYYHLDDTNKNISFTANDGSLWTLDTKTLIASQQQSAIKDKSSFDESPSQQRLKNLQRNNLSYSEMAINQDTINGKWIGTYSKEQLQNNNEKIPPIKAYGQNERRQLFSSTYKNDNKNNFMIDKTNAQRASPETFFLDGGLLLNKQTGNVIQLTDPASYLIVYKNQIGNEGKIMIGRVAQNGKLFWKLNTNLSSWTDWNYTDNQIFIYGNNRSELPNSARSLLLSVNVASGVVKAYDYFK